MIFFAEAYLSQLLGRTVRDLSGEVVGRLEDIVVEGDGAFPPVTKLVLRRKRQDSLVLPWSAVRSVSEEAIRLSAALDKISPSQLDDGDVLLAKVVLDRQIVDTHGRRVVKVNDLKLGAVSGRVRLIAAGVGTRSILRRLNLEALALTVCSWFRYRFPEQLISWEHVRTLEPAPRQLELDIEGDRLKKMHPADLADIISDLHANDRVALVSSLDEETAADALEEMEPEHRAALLDSLPDKVSAGILEEMAPDQSADLVADLSPERADELLSLMDEEEASDVRELLTYPEDSAGGLMTTEYVGVRAGLSAEAAIAHLREKHEDAEVIYYIYVVDNVNRLVGVMNLRDLILAAPRTIIDTFMVTDVIRVAPEAHQEEIAKLIARYNLLAIPVVDKDGELQGIVTMDDAIDAVLPTKYKKRIPRAFPV
ncbi:MAG: CBS domain-containing protein [Armatimonadetes bacterium]|nr:CBS domain-containing protein [Armatimonadota bacterium]NIO75056.1 CBS domain-containing protein [Armatimonadota bacterium]NIO95706.1 CBS domain-containing protein [Armatimonadota bacterium]